VWLFCCWRFNSVFFVGRVIHEFKILTKYLFTLVILHQIWNPQNNSSVHEHIYHLQTMKFHAHEIEWFHSLNKRSRTKVMMFFLLAFRRSTSSVNARQATCALLSSDQSGCPSYPPAPNRHKSHRRPSTGSPTLPPIQQGLPLLLRVLRRRPMLGLSYQEL